MPERYPEQGVLCPQEALAFLELVEMGKTDGISAWRSSDIERREGSQIDGQGLFALNDIPANMLVAIKQGHLVSGQTVSEYAEIIDGSQQQIGPDEFLTGLTMGEVEQNLVGYNHSCDPNAKVMLIKGISLAFLVSRQSIEAGAEITVDYGVSEMSPNAHYLNPCRCGSPQCRGVVDPRVDWQNEDLRRRYAGEFPWFVQEAIDADAEDDSGGIT